ncbi:unnamed protein product [Tetraodon nigroviridis]|uniref:(spotted green pufferfish) hypothetical protein n=1 Tax=Tetraodon nigroviridis TaxID=99883 RepID=Q4TB63_TETNG|nr:unnamed protein product [Tetraodon nigroviridis]
MGLVYSQPACRSAYAGDVQGLFAVLSEDPSQLNAPDGHSGDTPLIAACRRGNLRAVQYLLDNGADVRASNKKRRTALHYVSRRTFSLLDYLMIAVLMPVLLLGYFILLPKAATDGGVDAGGAQQRRGRQRHRLQGEHGSALRLPEEESAPGPAAAAGGG